MISYWLESSCNPVLASQSIRGIYRISPSWETHWVSGVGVLVVDVGVGESYEAPLVLPLAPLERDGVGDAECELARMAYSCLAARKLLRSELVSSRLERYAPGLRIMEGPPETMLLCGVNRNR